MRRLRLDWINRDGKLLILAGCLSAGVPRAFNLGDTGASATQSGLIFLAAGVVGLFVTLLVVVFAEKVGRRRLMVAFTLTLAAATAASALTDSLLVLLPFVFLGALSRAGGGIQSLHALLQASLADTAPPNKRTDLYAVYHIAEQLIYFPLLLVLAPIALFSFLFDLSEIYVDKAWATASVLLLLVAAFLYSRVSSAVEAPLEARRPMNPFKLPSRRVIFTLAGLFGLNIFASNLLFQSVTLHLNINWSAKDVFLVNLSTFPLFVLLGIPALWLAAKIANRFGLVNTLALTQMAAPLFFIPAAFVPPGGLSVLFRTLYIVLGQMGVPLRASYMMGVVAPEERVAAAGIIFLVMGFLGWPAPVFGAYFADTDQIIIPLFVGGLLAIGANLALYRMFRNVKPPEEAERLVADTL